MEKLGTGFFEVVRANVSEYWRAHLTMNMNTFCIHQPVTFSTVWFSYGFCDPMPSRELVSKGCVLYNPSCMHKHRHQQTHTHTCIDIHIGDAGVASVRRGWGCLVPDTAPSRSSRLHYGATRRAQLSLSARLVVHLGKNIES